LQSAAICAEQSAPLPPLVPPELLVVLPDDEVVLPEDDAPDEEAPDEDAPDEELPDELLLPDDEPPLVLDSPLLELEPFVPVSSLEHAAITAAHEMSPTPAKAASEFLADVMTRA